jgi:type I restriction-modification system DNA methylase subunit
MAANRRTAPPLSAIDLHRAWLELVDTEGPFLAIPPLKRVWPNGVPDFRTTYPNRFEALVEARKAFELAWETLDRNPDGNGALDAYRPARDTWVETVLRDVMGWADSLQWGTIPHIQAQSPNRAVTITAQGALVGPNGLGALVHVVDPTESLRHTPSDVWAATPVDRLEALLRENQVGIGIITDGRWWGLECAGNATMAASGIVDALTWVEEPRTRDAFLTLTGRQYLIGGDADERLPVLFEESIAAAEEITEALGAQVRRAVELLIQSFSESAAEARRRGVQHPLPTRTHETYEAAVTVMMRTVFLLFAEERGLLPSGELFEQGYGISRELDRLTAREKESNDSEEALDGTFLTWHRLLATSQALYHGASFENLRMPAYGGSLFDPERFPFLTTPTEQGKLAIAVSDRVMLHVLRSVQTAHVQGAARRISFRDIDVEQIGYIYEGLLGYTCVAVNQPHLGIIGTIGAEPEIPLAKLEALANGTSDPRTLATAIRTWVAEDQPSAKAPSVAAIAKAIQAEPDSSAISALAQVAGESPDLRDRIAPWLGLVRRDLRTHPFVVLADGLLVKETPSRKNAGAHYTPKSLAEEVVRHALQPLCYFPGPYQTAEEASWKLKTSDELLDLKVADIACGSGAFLVAAARYLAERLVEAWISEDPTNSHRKNLYMRAIRQVVANCLYGADINAMAAEMCKLSLWLVSLDRDLPFSFVDKVFVGNSLLGLISLDQLRKLHIDPQRAPERTQSFDIFNVDIDEIIRKAVDLRKRLATEINEHDPSRSSAAKRRQLNELHRTTDTLRRIADGVIATGLPLGGTPGRALDESYDRLRDLVANAHRGDSGVRAEGSPLDGIIDRGLTPTVKTDYERWKPLHWVLEIPDVVVERGGFDAVIGNPPFLGFKKITPAVGEGVRYWYANQLAGGKVANADLVAFFLNRAWKLSRGTTLGLVATSTIAEGDTRSAGLDRLVADGFIIARCVRSERWPASSASLDYSIVWGGKGVLESVPRIADGNASRAISTLLEPAGRLDLPPLRLEENRGIGFQGCIPLGKGFSVSEEEAKAWTAMSARNADVLFPFLNGDDISSRPDSAPSRWIINFGARSFEQAMKYREPFQHIEERVKPERAKNNNKRRREVWWQFAGQTPELNDAMRGLTEVLGIVVVSKAIMPQRLPTGAIMSNSLDLFTDCSYAFQALISSSAHQLWAITYGSTLGSTVRYVLSDVFETFPRPLSTNRLEQVGRTLDDERREIMLRRALGLTKLYNLVNDPRLADESDSDVARMRAIHVDLDLAVMEAYGWDILLDHGFYTYRQMERWTVSSAARVEIVDRLLQENHRRAAEEAAKVAGGSKGRRAKAKSEGAEALLS